MTSNAIRGMRRKKSSLSEVKIAVLGAPGVGKSEQRYRNEILVDNEPILFEILDPCNKNSDALPSNETIAWADGFLLVYSITDRQSFNWAKRCRLYICDKKLSRDRGGGLAGGGGGGSCGVSGGVHSPGSGDKESGCVMFTNNNSNNNNNSHQSCLTPPAGLVPPSGDISPTIGPPCPIVLVANKADMVHLRQVSTEEGEILAKDLECYFNEVAASEQVLQVANAFHELCREVQLCRKRNKTSLLDRVLGSTKASKMYVRGKSDSALPKD
ncbi:ras-related and estrogen-regulated growth inhibitor isoform X2 [Oratosquilla oratoria]|uniref:ras-related and estrogen-regulated growth inhibitor isoform X2 n=1 Tax=Oratosquilla oratoria TaxID=337810 RepID=UPI003F772AC5